VLLVILALGCVATVPLARGNLARLLELRLRSAWAAFAAIALQVAITSFPRGSAALHSSLHVLSYGLAGAFLVANRRVPGLWVMAAGGALNLLAIAVNGGVMPASSSALAVAGLPATDGFANSAALSQPHLAFLGDVIGVPGPWPIGNVLSVGDLVLFAGLLVLLHRACGGARRAPRPSRARGCAAR
jgi:hypothetical protein